MNLQIKQIDREIKLLKKQSRKIDDSIIKLQKNRRAIEMSNFKKSCKYKIGDNVRAEKHGGIYIRGEVIGYQCGYDGPQIQVLHRQGGRERWELFREETVSRIEAK